MNKKNRRDLNQGILHLLSQIHYPVSGIGQKLTREHVRVDTHTREHTDKHKRRQYDSSRKPKLASGLNYPSTKIDADLAKYCQLIKP